MKVHYDTETDTLTMRLSERPVAESDEASPGVILDYDSVATLSESRFWRHPKQGPHYNPSSTPMADHEERNNGRRPLLPKAWSTRHNDAKHLIELVSKNQIMIGPRLTHKRRPT